MLLELLTSFVCIERFPINHYGLIFNRIFANTLFSESPLCYAQVRHKDKVHNHLWLSTPIKAVLKFRGESPFLQQQKEDKIRRNVSTKNRT